MPVTRASEIGSYLYCHRAWWYRKLGYESENVAELTAGTSLHRRHGWSVFSAGVMRVLGWLLLAVAVVLFVLYLLGQLS